MNNCMRLALALPPERDTGSEAGNDGASLGRDLAEPSLVTLEWAMHVYTAPHSEP